MDRFCEPAGGPGPAAARWRRRSTLARTPPFRVNLWRAQNRCYEMLETVYPLMREESGEAVAGRSGWSASRLWPASSAYGWSRQLAVLFLKLARFSVIRHPKVGVDFHPMKEDKWPSLPQDPRWVLEQIEMGFRQIEPDAQISPLVPKLRYDEIESAVTRALQEELARLDELEEQETETPGRSRALEEV